MTVQLPDVGWTFIHGQPDGVGSISLLRREGDADVVTDAEGRWSHGPPAETVPLRGYCALLSEDELAWAAARGVKASAVVAVARGTVVDADDEVTLAGVDAHLDGTYRVTVVRSTPVHLRVLLAKPVEPAGGE